MFGFFTNKDVTFWTDYLYHNSCSWEFPFVCARKNAAKQEEK